MSFWAFSGLVNLVTSVFLGILVFSRGPRESKNYTFGLFCLVTAAWSFAYLFWQLSAEHDRALFWARALMFGGIFVPICYFHHLIALAGERGRLQWFIRSIYVFGFLSLLADCTPYFIKDVSARELFRFWPDPGLLFYPFVVIWFALCLGETVYIFYHLKRARGVQAEQLKYVFIGTVIGWGGAFTNYPLWFGIPIPPVGNIGVSVYLLVVAYAIARYRLMDIRVAMSSAGIFLGIYSLTFGVPFLLYARGSHLAALLTAIALATPAPFLYNRLKKQAEDKILSAERADQEVLLGASKGLSKHKTVDEIVKFVCFIFGRILKARSLAFYLNDGDTLVLHDASLNGAGFPKEIPAGHPLTGFFKLFNQPQNIDEFKQTRSILGGAEITELLARIPAQLAVPVMRGDKLIGLIFLGAKEEDQAYSMRDMEVLGVISDQVALAVENAGYLEMTKKDFIEVMHDRRLKDIGILGSTISHQMCNRLQRVTLGVGMFKVNFNEEALANDSREQLVAKLRETYEDMNVIERNAVSAAEISDALKTFSKPGVDPAVVAFRRLIKIARDLVDAKHKQFVYEFIAEFPQDLVLYVNEPSMQDVFFNAFDNGLDAIKMKMNDPAARLEGFRPRITVRARKQGEKALIEIEDNGIGFKPEDQDKMFIPFFTTKGSDKGTGLGLHAMRELVRRNGGAIDIASEYLQGVKVAITLPVADGKV